MDDERKMTSSQWLYYEYPRTVIMDADGWDRSNHDAFQYSFYEEMITEQEFLKRVSMSTIRIKSHD